LFWFMTLNDKKQFVYIIITLLSVTLSQSQMEYNHMDRYTIQ